MSLGLRLGRAASQQAMSGSASCIDTAGIVLLPPQASGPGLPQEFRAGREGAEIGRRPRALLLQVQCGCQQPGGRHRQPVTHQLESQGPLV
jgi:hypothetical protein